MNDRNAIGDSIEVRHRPEPVWVVGGGTAGAWWCVKPGNGWWTTDGWVVSDVL